MKIATTIACLLALLPLHSLAESKPTTSPLETRLVVFTYDSENSYTIQTRPLCVTDVQFPQGEHISAMVIGDSMEWGTAKSPDGRHLFIKPKVESISTSATVVTNLHTYQLMLVSNPLTGKWYQQVSFDYSGMGVQMSDDQTGTATAQPEPRHDVPSEPEEKQDKKKDAATTPVTIGVPLDKLSFDYDIEGDAPFKPNSVFDDGRFTYIRMPSTVQEWPALFLLTSDGDAEIINYVVKGNYYVVSRLMSKFILKIKNDQVTISKHQSFLKRVFGNGNN